MKYRGGKSEFLGWSETAIMKHQQRITNRGGMTGARGKITELGCDRASYIQSFLMVADLFLISTAKLTKAQFPEHPVQSK